MPQSLPKKNNQNHGREDDREGASSELPRHVAIIMDGNGRWAKQRNLARLEGHRAGTKSVRRVVEACLKLGIPYLTLFSFSTENWQRSTEEVSGLMELFCEYLDSELQELSDNGIRLLAVGDLARLPTQVSAALARDIAETRNNAKLTLVLAVSYGGREEIVSAAKALAEKAMRHEVELDRITPTEFSKLLWTKDLPDPDLLIRTSGEQRISNFLLWQLAYSEIVVAPELWPDFDEDCFERCLDEYRRRERRFGLTSDQVEQVDDALDAINL